GPRGSARCRRAVARWRRRPGRVRGRAVRRARRHAADRRVRRDPAHRAGQTRPGRHRGGLHTGAGLTVRGAVVAATSAMVMLVLDSSIVGVMLPSMRTDLHLGPGAQAWIVAIYLLTLAVLLPVGGRLCDALGAARTFAVGMAGFTVASAGVGLSTAGVEIIAWRGFAGCAAALMMPTGLAMIAEVVPEDRRPGALAVYTGVGQAFAHRRPAGRRPLRPVPRLAVGLPGERPGRDRR